MRKFLNILLLILIKPFTAIIIYSGDDKFIRFANKKKIIIWLFWLVFATVFNFLFFYYFLKIA